MKNTFLLFLLFPMILYAQNKNAHSSKDFNDKVIDFAIENCEDLFIELPDLYGSIVENVADDEHEKLILAEKLKIRGFKQTNWDRGNNPPFGPRIIAVTYKKEECECDVIKIYYSTTNESEYKMTEKIKCRKAGQ